MQTQTQLHSGILNKINAGKHKSKAEAERESRSHLGSKNTRCPKHKENMYLAGVMITSKYDK